ncbi:MAG: hypothetical protein Q7S89_00445 [bacterium]|nr:hypothetical protein [bacterium]
MTNLDRRSFTPAPLDAGRMVACPVCCRHYGHDCVLTEMEYAEGGNRFLMCFGPGCDGCGFTVGIELSDVEIRRTAEIRIEELVRQGGKVKS